MEVTFRVKEVKDPLVRLNTLCTGCIFHRVEEGCLAEELDLETNCGRRPITYVLDK
jgi:hypothetical protein